MVKRTHYERLKPYKTKPIDRVPAMTIKTGEILSISNRKEAGTMLVFHAVMSNEAVVIVAKDGDVFLLLIYALGALECPFLPWFHGI